LVSPGDYQPFIPRIVTCGRVATVNRVSFPYPFGPFCCACTLGKVSSLRIPIFPHSCFIFPKDGTTFSASGACFGRPPYRPGNYGPTRLPSCWRRRGRVPRLTKVKISSPLCRTTFSFFSCLFLGLSPSIWGDIH